MKRMNGRSTSGTTGLGTVVVSGRRRVPSPPARISACIASGSSRDMPPISGGMLREGPLMASVLRGWCAGRRRPPDALVAQPGGDDRLRIEEVAPVDDERAA